jgi:hypothetical protein
MRDRRFVPSPPEAGRSSDSLRKELRDVVARSPWAIRKIREKNAELDAKIDSGELTHETAQAQYLRFATLLMAHVREHELEGALRLKDRPDF